MSNCLCLPSSLCDTNPALAVPFTRHAVPTLLDFPAMLQAKLEEAEQKLRLALQGQQTAEQTRQMETLDAELAAAREALTAERELSERLSEELGKTQVGTRGAGGPDCGLWAVTWWWAGMGCACVRMGSSWRVAMQ